MSCRLQSRITALLLVTATLPLCLTTHGSVGNRSKPKGEDDVNLETDGQQSNAASPDTPSRSSSQATHAVLDETNISYMLTPGQGGPPIKDLVQSDSPGSDGQTVQGKVQLSSNHVTPGWLQMRPLVQCSPAAIILTAKGLHKNYMHLLVDQVGASPVPILRLPSHCGYNMKATWRDLVLMAPYNGCYVLQQNGSYVLPLLWWGIPISISCPMTPASAPATPSGFCSYFGMTLKIAGSPRSIEKYSIKVNEEWVPLISNTCAYRVDSAAEDLIIFIPFTAQCAKDGGSTTDVFLDGKMYTLSCQPHHHLPYYPHYNRSAPFSQPLRPIPLEPSLTKPAIPKPHLVPEMTTMEQSQQTTPVGATGVTVRHPEPPSLPSYDISQTPVVHSAEIPTRIVGTKITTPTFQPPLGYLQPNMHIMYPIYPYYHHFYHQKCMPPDSHITDYISALRQTPEHQLVPVQNQRPQMPQPPWVPQMPQPPWVPQMPQPPRVPQTPQPPQMPQPPQVPHKPQTPGVAQVPRPPRVPHRPQPPRVPGQRNQFPVLANDSSRLSPVLICNVDHLRTSLPSAKINSIKVRDVKRKIWVPVSSAPAYCGYSLKRKGKGVVFSSPLPACHSYTVSPSLLSLSLKFWDPAIPRHRTIQLQCPYTSPSPTITMSSATKASLVPKTICTRSPTATHERQPSYRQKPLGPYSDPSKPIDSPIHSQNFIVPSFQQSKDSKPTSWPPKHTWSSQSTALVSQMHQPQILCYSKGMNVTLPPGPITGLTVQAPTVGIKGSIEAVLLDEAPRHCGYLMKKNQNGGINILLPYESCHMVHQNGQYRILLKYQTANGHRVEAFLSCQVPMSNECSLPLEQQIACGPGSVSAVGCHELGCCYFPDTETCYYPMDVCTADHHFIFSIPASLTEPPLSPALLVAGGNSSCTPQRVVADLALFKIPLDGCGTHRYEVGNAVIYMLEILNMLHSVTHHYGIITRDSPFRLLVECRYLPSTVASVGYLVKSPTLGPSIQAKGVFGVQLRIAKDQQYSSYYPQYHRPLRKLLGKPLYLEVRLLNPLDPSVVLLVHYCIAYPRSAHSAWVLIYDGCPNPFDEMALHEPPPPTPPEGLANHVRRFTVSTFQFLENNRKEILPGQVEKEEEEIYFMCATEVCLPSEGPCVEGCFDRAVDSPAVES